MKTCKKGLEFSWLASLLSEQKDKGLRQGLLHETNRAWAPQALHSYGEMGETHLSSNSLLGMSCALKP